MMRCYAVLFSENSKINKDRFILIKPVFIMYKVYLNNILGNDPERRYLFGYFRSLFFGSLFFFINHGVNVFFGIRTFGSGNVFLSCG